MEIKKNDGKNMPSMPDEISTLIIRNEIKLSFLSISLLGTVMEQEQNRAIEQTDEAYLVIISE